MGWTYEVMTWVEFNGRFYAKMPDVEYKYVPAYQGESFFKAMYCLLRLKFKGAACVKLEWR